MSKFFLDTEFHEFKKKQLIGKPIDTIELISIGIVREDVEKDAFSKRIGKTDRTFTLSGREYYAICKEFDLKAAWNSFQMDSYDRMGNLYSNSKKVYWLRENVLKPIFSELVEKDLEYYRMMFKRINTWTSEANIKHHIFNYKNFKRLLEKYGKTREQIAKDILWFTTNGYFNDTGLDLKDAVAYEIPEKDRPEFYAYYADYDWVVFCWLFGRMIDLPKGFPMYCKDLKQMLDEHFKVDKDVMHHIGSCINKCEKITKEKLQEKFHEDIDHKKHVPQAGEHNALNDALFCKKLYYFLRDF